VADDGGRESVAGIAADVVGHSATLPAAPQVDNARPTPIDPEPFKVVAALDLSLMVPALGIGGVLLWKRRPSGYLIATIAAIQGVVPVGAIRQLGDCDQPRSRRRTRRAPHLGTLGCVHNSRRACPAEKRVGSSSRAPTG
jgi:hypothetical protein